MAKSINKKNAFTVPRRISWYVLRTVLIITTIVVLAFFIFLTAMHAANIYIVVSEGITLRTACILGDGDPNELYEYYTEKFVQNDLMLTDSVYSYYNINSYDYRLNINSIDIWPWDTTATMTITERIPKITGTANADAPESAIPEWQSGKYIVTCVKIDERWYITEITLIEKNPPQDNLATPDMSLITPTPTHGSTPNPDISPS